MRRRLHELLGVATVFTIVTVLLQLTAGSVRGQAPSATAWGHPALEGIWLDVYATPLERAAELGDRVFATAEERAARDQVQLDRNPTLGGAYSAVYTSAKPAGPRTSLVVDPPNGRIPALTPEPSGRTKWSESGASCSCETQRAAGAMRRPVPGGVRAPVSAQIRYHSLLQYGGPHEPPRRPGGSEFGRPLHVGAHTRFHGFRRIVQGEDSIAMAYDTGQGQGFQRVIYLSGSHPPSQIRLRHGDSRGRWGG